jgi:tetratricopeptide (TPR) repeat protein
MRTRFCTTALPAAFAAAVALSVASLVLAPVPALAQSSPPDHQFIEPPKDLPAPGRDNKTNNLSIDRLFDALKVAPDDASAKYIENRIWARWTATDSDTATLLMSRVKIAVDAKDIQLGIKLLTAIIELRPDYLEAWNRRATLYYQEKDFEHSLDDIAEVLKREPRHFGALSGMGMIFQEIGDDKAALTAFRRALAIDPHLEHIPDLVKQLTEKVEGRPI